MAFPGEAPDTLVVTGAYVQQGRSVELIIGGEHGTWTLTGNSQLIVLTENRATSREYRHVAQPLVSSRDHDARVHGHNPIGKCQERIHVQLQNLGMIDDEL